MKKFFAFLTFCCLPVHVYAGTITGSACGDDCTWHLDDGVLTVVGSGRINEYQRECTDMDCTTDAPWFQYQEDITKVVIQNKSDTEVFTSVGAHAFEDMTSTREIVLPEGLKHIESEAFHLNRALETINLPNSLESIGAWGLSNSNMSEINIPEGVSTVGLAAFNGVPVKTLVLPDSLETLEDRICSECESLETVVLPENISIGYTGAISGSFDYTPSLSNLYCHVNNQDVCAQILRDSGKTEEGISALLKSYDKQSGVYIADGKYYFSGADMADGANECAHTLSECKQEVLETRGICQASVCQELVNADERGEILEVGGKQYASLQDLYDGNEIVQEPVSPAVEPVEDNGGSTGEVNSASASVFNSAGRGKRIYTTKEANEVAGKKNKVMIRYK